MREPGLMHFIRVTVLLAAGAPLSAAVIEKSVEDLTIEADRIVIGDVMQVAGYWLNGRIESDVTLEITDQLKGDGQNLLILHVIGGTVGDTSFFWSVAPRFEEGDHVLLFLDEGATHLAGEFQGAYLTDGDLVAQMQGGWARMQEDTVQPLANLLQRIRDALPNPAEYPDVITPYQGDFELPMGLRYVLLGIDWTYMLNPMGENYRINGNCVDSSAGSASNQITAITLGASAWTNSGADFVFTYGGTHSVNNDNFDGVNRVYFWNSSGLGSSTIAVTGIFSSGNNITEWDMIFNDFNYTFWDGVTGSCGGSRMDIQGIAAHEMGHALGLDHTSVSSATMFASSSFCNTGARSLHSDDINGAVAIYGESGVDTLAPTPDPMTFASNPAPTSTTSIDMTATTAIDADNPAVEYLFEETTGGPGATSSAWQSSTTYEDTGLSVNTQYSYRVKARDGYVAGPNETGFSSAVNAATMIETPTGIVFGAVTSTSIAMSAAGSFTNMGVGQSAVLFDAIEPAGDIGIRQWTASNTDTSVFLSPDTAYTYQAMARNQLGVQTPFGPAAVKATLAEVPAAPTLGNASCSGMTVDVNPNGNPSTTNYSIRCTGTVPNDANWSGQYVAAGGGPTESAVYRTDALWGEKTLTGMQPNTTYTFEVVARNQELATTAPSPTSSLATQNCSFGNGDMDDDGDVDVVDLGQFFNCFDVVPVLGDCSRGNFNGDGAVDLTDFGDFAAAFTGP